MHFKPVLFRGQLYYAFYLKYLIWNEAQVNFERRGKIITGTVQFVTHYESPVLFPSAAITNYHPVV